MIDDSKIERIILDTIRAEGQSVLKLADYITPDFTAAVREVFESGGRVVVTGIGKSAHIGGKLVATLNSTGTPAIFMHAADAVHGDLGIIQKEDVLFVISKSGETPEIKVLLPLIKNNANPIIALTSNTGSYLAQQADYVLHAFVEKEVCPNNLAPTTSTTAQLVLGDAFAMALLHLRDFTSDDFARYHPGGTLGKRLYLRVSDLLGTGEKPVVSPDDPIRKVIIEISSKRLGSTAVMENGELLGIITDGDLRRMLQNNPSLEDLSAKDIMSRNPKVILHDALVTDALKLMKQHNITQLLVMKDGKYSGMIHLHDILKEGIL